MSSAALQALLHYMHTLAPGSSVPCGETGLQGGYRGMWALQNWSFITGLLWAFFGQFLYLTNMVNLRILYVLFSSSCLYEMMCSDSSNGRLPGGKPTVVF